MKPRCASALIGELGLRIRKFATIDSQAHRISQVISILQERYIEPLRIGELAEQANMSECTLFHTFKKVTRMMCASLRVPRLKVGR